MLHGLLIIGLPLVDIFVTLAYRPVVGVVTFRLVILALHVAVTLFGFAHHTLLAVVRTQHVQHHAKGIGSLLVADVVNGQAVVVTLLTVALPQFLGQLLGIERAVLLRAQQPDILTTLRLALTGQVSAETTGAGNGVVAPYHLQTPAGGGKHTLHVIVEVQVITQRTLTLLHRCQRRLAPVGPRAAVNYRTAIAITSLIFLPVCLAGIGSICNFAFRRANGGDSPAPFIAVKGYSGGGGWFFL